MMLKRDFICCNNNILIYYNFTLLTIILAL